MNIRFGTPVLVWAAFCLIRAHGGLAPSSFSGRQATDVLTPTVIEEGLLDSLNRERERNGCPPLRPLPALVDVARAHSRKMAAASRLFHDSESEKPLTDRLVAAGLYFSKAGENVARSDSFLPAFIHQALLESPPHRENILDPDFDAVGVGVVSVGDRTYYVSQVFLRAIRILDEDEAAAKLRRLADEIRREAGLPLLVFWEEADRFAGTILVSRSRGDPPPKPPARFGGVKAVFTESPFLGFEDKTASEIVNPLYTRVGLALDVKRTKANPGGAYLLALLLMFDLQLDRPEEEMARAVLDAVNADRTRLGLPGLRSAASLAAKARRAASASAGDRGKGSPLSLPEPGYRFMTYTTFDPGDRPAEVDEQVLAAGLRSIGIRAACRRTEEYPLGAIQVVIALRAHSE